MTKWQKIARLRALIAITHAHGLATEALLRIARNPAHIAQLRAHLAALKAINKARYAEIWALKHPPKPRPPANRRFGIDFAWGDVSMAALKAAGVTFVIRYLSNDPSKNLHGAYERQLTKAGIDTVVVWETTANRATQGYGAGAQDARDAHGQAKGCGMPDGRPIYFAVDFDAAGPEVESYFSGVRSVLGTSGSGVYGGYRVVKYLGDRHIVKFFWQTYAWSGGQWYAPAQLFQYSNGHNVGGVDTDFDHSATVADFGQWRG